jgi:hypothetical protein
MVVSKLVGKVGDTNDQELAIEHLYLKVSSMCWWLGSQRSHTCGSE